ncbi:hypothetical protein CONCODRAFT_7969 [Conidiobolus coronatus NRRL 28638]|uniref:Uncharacterized protein n=1 Tax=Conidiobolus coronatus (strain ATCC 28846 / CBS 209.66 / NRRL 28638) TaxID=796925 RepID=A0A137P3I6_CONC2|nr:hypothetical protein CONCODRAFT_7969 [Conidiobolus coronatus NRRL 28638]|eukprot:KXN69558.1 hypothetical protein CONCODRAFT_7969 [Conidiobolus coronatus NRRL 28638]
MNLSFLESLNLNLTPMTPKIKYFDILPLAKKFSIVNFTPSIVAIADNTLSIVSVEQLVRAINQASVPLKYTVNNNLKDQII